MDATLGAGPASPSACDSRTLQVLDVRARVRSDCPPFLDHFDRQYRRFLHTSADRGDTGTLEYALDTDPAAWPEHLTLSLNAERWTLPRSDALLAGYLQEAVMAHILERVRGYFVIHAGAVAHDGKATVLVADSGHGKTTLVLELLRRGWDFLSDDIAALHCDDGRVHPFPRALHVRAPRTLAGRAACPPFVQAAKAAPRVLDLETLYPGQIGRPCPLGSVWFLKNPEANPTHTGVKRAAIVVDRLPKGLLESIHAIPGVARVERSEQDGLPLLRLALDGAPGALEQAVARCRAHQVLVLAVLKPQAPWPRFIGPARHRSIAPAPAARHLLPHLLTGTQSALLEQGFGGRPTQMFRGLARTLRSVPCYELDVGPLDDMANLVAEATSGHRWAPPPPHAH